VSGSTRTARSPDRSINNPPFGTEIPNTLCPPQRTPTSRSLLRAKSIAAATSALLVHRTTTAGRRSTIAFHSARAES
jgi:hypothetical protein